MSDYTMQLREVVERGFDIGLKDYPIFDEAYREHLNQRIMDHFWYREIGYESPLVFAHRMRTRMHEYMPIANQLYEAKIAGDPFITTDISTIGEHTRKDDVLQTDMGSAQSTDNLTSESGVKTRSVAQNETANTGRTGVSEFPQVRLSENGDYMTNASDIISSARGQSTGNNATTTKGNDVRAINASDSRETAEKSAGSGTRNERVSGFTGNKAAMLLQLRETFINVDLKVIEQLESLFMAVWTKLDYYSY